MAGELTTTNYGWVKPTVGASTDAWGGYINADLDGIDATVKGVSNAIPAASSTTPAMDGTAAVGTGTTWARADHIHPTDTSRAAVSAIPAASSTTPTMNGTAAIGTGTTFARADHVHPSDTSKLSLSGGVLTGALTPASAGIVGVTDASNAPAGAVGEFLFILVTVGVSLTTGTAATVGTLALTAGDWDISGELWLNVSAGATILGGALNNSAAFPAAPIQNASRVQLAAAFTNSNHILALAPCRVTISAGATYYLMASVTFSSGTASATGKILARRCR